MLHPDFITFTGADDETSIADMVALAADHPVEFAILFSESREGTSRYPTMEWMEGLMDVDLKLAAHVCGSWASEIVETGKSSIAARLSWFDRIQVNTAVPLDIGLICDLGKQVSDLAGREVPVILQTRDTFPEDDRVQWLFDASGGRGLSPAAWPAPPVNPSVRIGYAGGLGPDNVQAALQQLPAGRNAWIDMETCIRNGRDEFDIGLCRDVCEKAYHRTGELA